MKNKLVCDLHMHTLASGHAYGTIREMAHAAAERNLQMIGITEHGPGIPGTCDPIYFGALAKATKRYEGVEILYGCEANPNNEGQLQLQGIFLNQLDYLIAGIHCMPGLYSDRGIEKNTDNLVQCMQHPLVHIISHPDCDDTPLDYDRLAKAAKENQVALELNNSSLLEPERRRGCYENYKKMLAACMKYRCNIVIDTDAHDPDYVGVFDKAIEYLKDIDFDEELILNTSVEKFKKFIGKE